MNIEDLIEGLSNEQDSSHPIIKELQEEFARQEDFMFANEMSLRMAQDELDAIHRRLLDCERRLREKELEDVDSVYFDMLARANELCDLIEILQKARSNGRL